MKKVLYIAFSTELQYPPTLVKEVNNESVEVELASAFDVIHSNERPLTVLNRLVGLCRGKRFFQKSDWITASRLATHLSTTCAIEAKIVSPSMLRMVGLVFQSLRFLVTDAIWIKNTLRGRKLELHFDGHEVSAYLRDGLMRYQSGFHIQNGYTIVNLILGLGYISRVRSYVQWFISLVKRSSYDLAVINHNVYSESGLLGLVMFDRKVPVIHINSQQSAPLLLKDYRSHWRLSLIDDHWGDAKEGLLKETFVNEALPHFEKAAITYRSGEQVKSVDYGRKLIAMHAFTDANNIHANRNSAGFPSYYEWIRYTLEIAKEDENSEYIFRLHPSTYRYYKKDPAIVASLFDQVSPNVTLQNPIDSPPPSLCPVSPLVVTFKGSIALESALLGMRAITLGQAVCPPQCMWEMTSRLMYRAVLLGKQTNRLLLSDAEIRLAQSWKHQMNHAFRAG